MDENISNGADNAKVSNTNSNMDVYSSHKSILLQLHNEAPKPLRVNVKGNIEKPPYFGSEYHGVVSGRQAEVFLEREGQYLVRNRKHQKDTTLSFRVNGSVHHYRLFYDGQFFIKPEKKFSSLYNLVAEGLMIKFLESNAESYFIMPQVIPNVTVQPSNNNLRLVRSKSDRDRTTSHNLRISYWLGKCTDCNSLVLVGYKCNSCGYRHHEKCSAPFRESCTHNKSIFGGELGDPDFQLQSFPFILDMCIQEVEKRGICENGIYRVSAFSEDIEKLATDFDKNKQHTKLDSYNVHVVAGVLKRWLRSLPVSIIPPYNCTCIHDVINKYQEDVDFLIKEIRKVLRSLKSIHYACLQRLTLHMKKIALAEDKNMMTSYNLAVVFAPALSPSDYDNIESNIVVTKFLINYCDNIFL